MSKTIIKLFNGELEPVAYIGKDNYEMKNLFHLIETTFEKLENSLEENNKNLFEEYHNYIQKYIILSGEESFSAGYCIGTKITAEALINSENITPHN